MWIGSWVLTPDLTPAVFAALTNAVGAWLADDACCWSDGVAFNLWAAAWILVDFHLNGLALTLKSRFEK